METGIQRIFLIAGLLLAPLAQAAEESSERSILDRIISPDLERREIHEDDLDTENFEVGVYYGVMNVEDFGSNDVIGLRLAYHVTEDIFVEAAYGETTLGETSYERLSGSVQILTDDQRDMSYYNLSVGYNFLPGEIYIGKNWAFNSTLYLLGGVGNTEFAGDDYFTYSLGMGMRLLLTDWLAVHTDFRAHTFDHELLGEEQTVLNLEASIGLTVFF